eukprot:1255689-Rhodomonas_salina.1
MSLSSVKIHTCLPSTLKTRMTLLRTNDLRTDSSAVQTGGILLEDGKGGEGGREGEEGRKEECRIAVGAAGPCQRR